MKGPKFVRQLDDSEWTILVSHPVEQFPNVLTWTSSIMSVSPSNNDQAFLKHVFDITNKLTKIMCVLTSVQRCFSKWKQMVFQTDLDLIAVIDAVRITQLMLVRAAKANSFSPTLKLMKSGLTFEEAVEAIPKN